MGSYACVEIPIGGWVKGYPSTQCCPRLRTYRRPRPTSTSWSATNRSGFQIVISPKFHFPQLYSNVFTYENYVWASPVVPQHTSYRCEVWCSQKRRRLWRGALRRACFYFFLAFRCSGGFHLSPCPPPSGPQSSSEGLRSVTERKVTRAVTVRTENSRYKAQGV